MLTILTALLIAALITALLAYYYQKVAFEKKSNQQAKQALSKRSKQIKNSFRQNLERVASSNALTEKSEAAIFRLANYYFVFQSITPETVEQFSLLTKDLIAVIDEKLAANEESTNEATQQQLERFAAALPQASGAYTANFYRSDLPLLIFHLKEDNQHTTETIAEESAEDTKLAS